MITVIKNFRKGSNKSICLRDDLTKQSIVICLSYNEFSGVFAMYT